MPRPISLGCRPDDEIYLSQVLPSLFKRTKTQTMRPAWIPSECCKALMISTPPSGSLSCSKCGKHLSAVNHIKFPRFKVDDISTLMWKQRSSPMESWFCSKCGRVAVLKPIHAGGFYEYFCEKHGWLYKSDVRSLHDLRFPKIFGDVAITEVFNMIMGKEGKHYYTESSRMQRFGFYDAENSYIAGRDGFRSVRHMFKWFDKEHDLSIPKPFNVRRWRWL